MFDDPKKTEGKIGRKETAEENNEAEQRTEQKLTSDCGMKNEKVDGQNSGVEDIGVIEILCRMIEQMSCTRKLFYVCGTIALVIFFCLEEKMDYFRQYDDAVRDFVGNVYGVLRPLLAMLFGALALMVTFGTNSSKFRSQQGKEKKVPLVKGIANFVVSISLHTLALISVSIFYIIGCTLFAYLATVFTLLALLSIIDIAFTLFASSSFVSDNKS